MKKILFLLIVLCIGCSQEPQTLEELRTAGQNAYVDGDYSSAQIYFSKALLIKASDRDVLYYLGQTFQKLHQDDSAVYYFKRADLLYPNDRELNLAIYHSAEIIKDYTNRIKAIHVLIKTGDAPEPYQFELADLNLRAGNIFVSYLILKKIWENKTDDPNIYLALGNVSAQVDSVEFAAKITREAINRFGEKEQFVVNLAIYLAGAGELAEAEKVLRKVLKKNPKIQSYKMNLANILSVNESKSKKEEGLKIYQNLRLEYGNILNLDSLIVDLLQQLEK